jgi:plastocyanin
MRSRRVIGVGLLVATAAGTASAQSPTEVAVQLFQFRPGVREVTAGTRVTWTNRDDIEHSVTSGTPEQRDARFDLHLASKDAQGGVAFERPGVYPYFCDRHPSMRGEIRVR